MSNIAYSIYRTFRKVTYFLYWATKRILKDMVVDVKVVNNTNFVFYLFVIFALINLYNFNMIGFIVFGVLSFVLQYVLMYVSKEYDIAFERKLVKDLEKIDVVEK